MSKIKLTTVAFEGTAEQESELRAALAEIKTLPGAVMPALQKAQEIYGYLPIEVQKIIAEVLCVSLEEVFGVSTFYSQFNLNPQGKYQVGVCMGTACYVKGANEVLDKFRTRLSIDVGECTEDGKFSLEACRCIGACGLAPVVTINDEVYGKLTADDVDGILDDYEAR